MEKIIFETYTNLTTPYQISTLKSEIPNSINEIKYRKYKITIEMVEEEDSVLIARLKTLFDKTTNHYEKSMIRNELKKFNVTI